MNYSLQVLITICAFAVFANARQCNDEERRLFGDCNERYGAPPPDYVSLNSQAYYKFHPQLLTWELAKLTCQEEGGHLVVLNSEVEAKFVSSLWNSGIGWAFIGTHDRFQEGHYVTIFNQTLEQAGYSKTFPGEPNGGVTENCGAMYLNALLGNYFCHLPLPFICEINQ